MTEVIGDKDDYRLVVDQKTDEESGDQETVVPINRNEINQVTEEWRSSIKQIDTTEGTRDRRCLSRTRNDIKLFFGYWLIWLCCIIGFLGLIIKAFDNQTESWSSLSSPLIIKLFEMLDDNYDYFVYKTFTHKYHNHRLRPPCMCHHHRWRLLCHHKSATSYWLIPSMWFPGSCHESMVLFLRVSCCFPAEKKTRSIPSPDVGQPWNCLHILTTSGYVWLTWACPDRRPVQ